MKYVVIAGIVILIGFLVALHFIPIGIEPLTEVYFENHTILPVNIMLNHNYSYAFTVHNLEYRDMNYTYNITAQYNDTVIPLGRSSFSLSNNQSVTFNQNFSLKNHFDRAKIEVDVTKDTNELIDLHFWVDEYVPVTITIQKTNSTNNSTNKTK